MLNTKEQLQYSKSRIASSIDNLQEVCFNLANEAGWWNNREAGNPTSDASCYALMHSELSEGLEGMRKNLMDDHLPKYTMETVELADTIIRILDYAGAKNLQVGDALVDKLVYNQSREDHKLENRSKANGKSV